MNIIGLSDIHGDTSNLAAVMAREEHVDIVLIAGDITHFGREPQAREIVSQLRKNCGRLLAVPGNCDHPEVTEYLETEGISIHRHAAVLEDVGFIGAGGSLPCPGRTPNETDEEGLHEALETSFSRIPGHLPFVLVTHQPPFGTANDSAASGAHVGSRSIRRFIEVHEPLICFTGHIHEGTGVDKIGRTLVANPGPLRTGKYVYATVGSSDAHAEIRGIPGIRT